MNYKTANIICSVLCTIGVMCLTLLLVLKNRDVIFFACGGLGIFFIALGFATKLLFFRCPRCGKRLPLKSEGGHCPHCGKML